MTNETTTLVVGLGSAHGDDQIGWQVAEEVNALLIGSPSITGIAVRKAKSPLDLLNWLDESNDFTVQRLLVCDACYGAGKPGTVFRWEWPTDQLECLRFSGSHDFGLVDVFRLAEKLDRLPPHVIIWGIQIGQTQPGVRMSPPLSKTSITVAREMIKPAEEWNRDETPVNQAREVTGHTSDSA